jgi:hypothetical protein
VKKTGQTGIPQKEGITKKNAGARTQDREDNVFGLCGVKLCNE